MKKMKTLTLFLAVLLLLSACGKKKSAEITVPETTAAVETTVPATTVPETTAATEPETLPVPAEDHIISTLYGDLHFPGDWAPFLKTEITENPYTVTFFAVLDGRDNPQKLFSLTFGGKAEEAAAAVRTGDGYVALAVINEDFIPDDTWTDQEVNIVFTMQEALNTVLENLSLADADVLLPAAQTSSGTSSQTSQQKPQSESQPEQQPETNNPGAAQLPESMKEDMAIDTPYMELHFPSKWAENLSIQVNESDNYSVSYNCSVGDHGDLHLFTVYFGGEIGAPLKTIKTESGEMVEIRIDVPELSMDSSWTEEEKSFAYAMQEDLNYLIGKLS